MSARRLSLRARQERLIAELGIFRGHSVPDAIASKGLSIFTDEAINDLARSAIIIFWWTRRNNRENRALHWAAEARKLAGKLERAA